MIQLDGGLNAATVTRVLHNVDEVLALFCFFSMSFFLCIGSLVSAVMHVVLGQDFVQDFGIVLK